MAQLHYNWKRFWYPRGTLVDLIDSGYLPDPESTPELVAHREFNLGQFYNPNIVSFDSIANIPCLVLIGEPGIGKSTALKEAFNQVPEAEEKKFFELGSYGSDTDLCNQIFRNDKFQAWEQGKHHFHLFLDSLDEGRLSINKNLPKFLSRELNNISSHCHRLFLRITCRTNDWSDTLEEILKELWGKDNVGVYHIAFLRKVDVIQAARENNLDDNRFLQEIYAREAVPLAIKPITLKFLLEIYKQNQQFPPSQKKLYLEGCEALCQENNDDRKDAKNFPKLTPKQLLITAARIAAITIFCKRAAICKDSESCSAEDINIQELWGSTEKAEGNQFPIKRDEIEETLGTGLFSSSNINRICFAHKSYAEFLAAWYLEQNQMSLTQIMSLIRHSDGKLIPQLHETAAWLGNLLPDVFREIMKTDPDVLLSSDVATANVEDRVALVETLLKLYDEEKILERPVENYRHYRKVDHPGLAAQLQPYICSLDKKEQARLVAIDIAEVCQRQELLDDLVEVVLEDLQPIIIRLSAVQAIESFNNIETKNKLKPKVFSNITNDPDSQLRLYLLNSLFPDCLSTKELFNVIADPTLKFSFGLYDYDLASKLKDHLQPDSLLACLAWVENKQAEVNFLRKFKRITDTILLKAFENIETEGVAEAIAKVVLFQLRHDHLIMNSEHDSQFLQELSNNDEKRYKVLAATLPLLSNLPDDLSLLVYSRTPLAFTRDIPWMIEHLPISASEQEQQILAQLISYIDSTSCQVQQSEGEDQFPVSEEPSAPSVFEQLPGARIIELLDEFGDVNLEVWENICREMVVKSNRSAGYQFWGIREIDLTVLPVWNSIDKVTKARIIEAAKKYVLQYNPGNYTVSSRNVYESDLFGYKALRLLLKENPPSIEDIPTNVWQKWTPFVLAYSPSEKTENYDLDKELLKRAYLNSHDTFLNTLQLLINEENQAYNSILIIKKLDLFWDSAIASFLLQIVTDLSLKPKSLECLLSQLIKHYVTEAKIFAESLITLPLAINEEERSRAVMAAQALIKYSEDAGWAIVWPAIQQDPQFGREVIEEVSFFARNSGNIESRLSEEQVAELYIWLAEQYPSLRIVELDQSTNPSLTSNNFLVTAEDSIDRWKDLILCHLKERGTPQSYEALQQIGQKLPQLNEKLKPIFIEAQESIRRHSWIPAKPDEIIELAKNQQVRLVKSGSDLLNIIIEQLDELQQRLQGETPAAIDLWNEIKRTQVKKLANTVYEELQDQGKLKNDSPFSRIEDIWELQNGDWRKITGCLYIPKDEERLSDYISRYLQEALRSKGIILHREVEIRRGEETDIYVNAVVKNSVGQISDIVSVIIEVKGCWNRKDLNTAMETQLVGRYLKDNPCQYGLYLIGWFNCEQWDKSDTRKDNAPKISLEEARQQFDLQAAQLSQQGVQVRAYVLNTALREIAK